MEVSVETLSGLERRLTVGVPAETIEADLNRKLQELSKTVKINGFRPGKVPAREVKRRYGKQLRQEILGDIIRDTFGQAVDQENLNPAGSPNIETKNDKAGESFEYTATFEVFPEIELKGLDGVKVEKLVAEITADDIDNMIANILQQHKSWETADRAAALDDQVIIDFVGTKDGEPFEGGSADANPLVLGSGSMIPGFEDGLVGLKAGEEKTLALTFPEDYQAEELVGQPVEFKVSVKEVNKPLIPELNDEFATKMGVEGGVEAFKEAVKKNMARELEQGVKNKLKSQLMDKLLEKNDQVEVPKALIKNEIHRMQQQMLQQFGGGANFDPSMFPQDLFTEQATRSVTLSLLVGEIIKAQGITADAARVRSTIEEAAQHYEQPEMVVNWYYSNQEKLAEVEAGVLEEQVVDYILSTVELEEIPSSYEDVLKRPALEENQEAAASA
ncbi:MAG TPA: trigger factor [Pseudomonadales bacterium]